MGGARSQAARRGVALSACSYRHTWPRPSLPDSWQGRSHERQRARTPVGAEIWALEASRGRSPRAARAGRLGPAARFAPPARAGGSMRRASSLVGLPDDPVGLMADAGVLPSHRRAGSRSSRAMGARDPKDRRRRRTSTARRRLVALSALALAALVLRAVAYLASWYPGDETIRASSESFLRLRKRVRSGVFGIYRKPRVRARGHDRRRRRDQDHPRSRGGAGRDRAGTTVARGRGRQRHAPRRVVRTARPPRRRVLFPRARGCAGDHVLRRRRHESEAAQRAGRVAASCSAGGEGRRSRSRSRSRSRIDRSRRDAR